MLSLFGTPNCGFFHAQAHIIESLLLLNGKKQISHDVAQIERPYLSFQQKKDIK